jgi:hypothetical protein
MPPRSPARETHTPYVISVPSAAVNHSRIPRPRRRGRFNSAEGLSWRSVQSAIDNGIGSQPRIVSSMCPTWEIPVVLQGRLQSVLAPQLCRIMVRHMYPLVLDKAAICRLDVAKSDMTRPPFPISTAVSARTRPRSCIGTNPGEPTPATICRSDRCGRPVAAAPPFQHD